jgi:hypothetical protein
LQLLYFLQRIDRTKKSERLRHDTVAAGPQSGLRTPLLQAQTYKPVALLPTDPLGQAMRLCCRGSAAMAYQLHWI